MGIGMIFVLNPEDAPQTIEILQKFGEKAYQIGTVIKGEGVTIL
jgi:phosphoribosylformylglycinamidine cyclo-ligase